MNLPKILFTASSPGIGLTFHTTRLAIALKRKGHTVIVVSGEGARSEEIRGLSNELRSEGIKHYKLPGLDEYVNPFSVWKLSKIMKAEDFDVIHTSGLIKLAKFYSAKLLSKKRETPLVLHIDSVRDETTIKKSMYIASSPILNSNSVIVPVSHWTKKRLLRYKVREDKMVVVHNAINLRWFDSVANSSPLGLEFSDEIKDKTIVAQVSTLYPWKGHNYLLTAAKKVLAANPNVHFLLVGNGPLRQKLENTARNLGISGDITFTGRVSNYHIPSLLSRIDVGVLASLRENLPRTLLEYMAAQKPIVATNVGGVQECVIDGVNGYLVPPRDPDSFSKRILELINDPDNARQMGKRGRRLVEQRFSMETFVKKLSDIYKMVLAY